MEGVQCVCRKQQRMTSWSVWRGWSTPCSLGTECWHPGGQTGPGMAQELSSQALRPGIPYEVRKVLLSSSSRSSGAGMAGWSLVREMSVHRLQLRAAASLQELLVDICVQPHQAGPKEVVTHKNVIISVRGCSWDKAVSAVCRTVAFSWWLQVRQLPGSIHLSLNAHICTKWYIWGWFYHPDVGDFNSSFISPVSDSQAPLTYPNTILRAVLLTLAATTKITLSSFSCSSDDKLGGKMMRGLLF